LGDKKKGHRLLVGKPEGKRPLGGPRYKWVHNINMDSLEMRWYRVVETGFIWLGTGISGQLL
jgi:hypothetical protein